MLGLWGPNTTLGRAFHKCHIAFDFRWQNCSLPANG